MVFDLFLSILFPPVCVGCRRIGHQICIGCKSDLISVSERICPGCQAVLKEGKHRDCRSPSQLDSIVSLYVYKGLAKKMLKQTKYQFVYSALKELLYGASLSRALSNVEQKSIVVPIPLHPTRLKWRGFNQSEMIGSLLASHLQLPQQNLLRRLKETKSQAQLRTRKEREENIGGAFAISDDIKEIPQSVILVDDVFTSGLTMREAATVLKKAGVQFVHGFTLMQGERQKLANSIL